ncbi:hypothetical protein LY78DRAFT_698110 [Colletotrichum sublineola]|nr:hypothetical protein LY78DRAFT_698110 [Colletotrichum sublineola]
MAHTTPELQQVYCMCRPLFSGSNAQLRKKKGIRKILLGNKDSLQPLFAGKSEKKLVATVQSLLENRAFESDLQAKVLFPDLFRTSPQRDAKREASKADVARSAVKFLEEIT